MSYKEVVQTFMSETSELVTVSTSDGEEIVGTPDHPYYVDGKGYIKAKSLRAGDVLVHNSCTAGNGLDGDIEMLGDKNKSFYLIGDVHEK